MPLHVDCDDWVEYTDFSSNAILTVFFKYKYVRQFPFLLFTYAVQVMQKYEHEIQDFQLKYIVGSLKRKKTKLKNIQ